MKLYVVKQHCGFTLIELMIVMAILGLLTAITLPSYERYRDKVDGATAMADIVLIEQTIVRFSVDAGALPTTLASIGMAGIKDPWGNAYQYLPFDASTRRGAMRKDKNLVPVNSDYDLYSMGKNGVTAKPFTSRPGRDDIVRANNGRFIGLAEDY